VKQFSQTSYNFIPPGFKYFAQHPILEYLQSLFSINDRDLVSQPYKATGKIVVLYILIFTFSDTAKETEVSEVNDSKRY
jgi:hypothetical protein